MEVFIKHDKPYFSVDQDKTESKSNNEKKIGELQSLFGKLNLDKPEQCHKERSPKNSSKYPIKCFYILDVCDNK